MRLKEEVFGAAEKMLQKRRNIFLKIRYFEEKEMYLWSGVLKRFTMISNMIWNLDQQIPQREKWKVIVLNLLQQRLFLPSELQLLPAVGGAGRSHHDYKVLTWQGSSCRPDPMKSDGVAANENTYGGGGLSTERS